MASVRIPERHLDGLITLLSLSDEATQQLISSLQDLPSQLAPPSVAKIIASKVQDIPVADLTIAAETLISVYLTKQYHEEIASELAESIYETLQDSDIEEIDSLIKDRDNVMARLTKLLNIESLNILSKAILVHQASENFFHDTRIISEIRPVFGSNPESIPSAAMILHMLNITYHSSGEMKEFYIALDAEDLTILREAIDRAILKEKSLKSVLNASKIPAISLG